MNMNTDLPRALQKAMRYLQSGPPEKCLLLCDEILAAQPGLIQALYLRGCAAFQTGDIGQAVSDLEIVYRSHPGHLHAAFHFGRCLLEANRLEEALEPLQAALGEKELAVQARYELAGCLARMRRRHEAIGHYRAILRLQPANAQVAANMATLLERENRLEEAAQWTARALQVDPANETAQMTRATLDRRSGNYPQAVQRLRALAARVGHPVNHSIVWNQLGQSLEGLEEWDQAFDAFRESNRLLQSHHPHSRPDPRGPHGMDTLSRIQAWLLEKPILDWKGYSGRDPGGIAFLVGFPRSGTTLLDHMLSAHPAIEVLEEKSLFSGIHQDWSQAGVLESLAEASEEKILDARGIYRRELSRHRLQPHRPLVIDKLPLNLNYLFLIYRLFPEAPVIFLQRHPLDVCLSCYFQAFELVASMAYFLDLGDTARYYDAVMQVARLSLDQVGNPLHLMRYEDLVAAPEDQLKALLAFLALEWDDSALNYRREGSSKTTNTPSYQQVTQPLHERSVGKWRHYQKQLEPCLAVLQPWIERYGYSEQPANQPHR